MRGGARTNSGRKRGKPGRRQLAVDRTALSVELHEEFGVSRTEAIMIVAMAECDDPAYLASHVDRVRKAVASRVEDRRVQPPLTSGDEDTGIATTWSVAGWPPANVPPQPPACRCAAATDGLPHLHCQRNGCGELLPAGIPAHYIVDDRFKAQHPAWVCNDTCYDSYLAEVRPGNRRQRSGGPR